MSDVGLWSAGCCIDRWAEWSGEESVELSDRKRITSISQVYAQLSDVICGPAALLIVRPAPACPQHPSPFTLSLTIFIRLSIVISLSLWRDVFASQVDSWHWALFPLKVRIRYSNVNFGFSRRHFATSQFSTLSSGRTGFGIHSLTSTTQIIQATANIFVCLYFVIPYRRHWSVVVCFVCLHRAFSTKLI